MTGPSSGLASNHCGNCALNYLSPYYPKYSTCPGCGRNGDRHGNVVPHDQRRDGPMSGRVEPR